MKNIISKLYQSVKKHHRRQQLYRLLDQSLEKGYNQTTWFGAW